MRADLDRQTFRAFGWQRDWNARPPEDTAALYFADPAPALAPAMRLDRFVQKLRRRHVHSPASRPDPYRPLQRRGGVSPPAMASKKNARSIGLWERETRAPSLARHIRGPAIVP